MRISLNRFLAILSLVFITSLFSSTLEEAKRNLDLGYYIISEYIYNDFVEAGNIDEEILEGLSLSLINQSKYQEIIALSKKQTCDSPLFQRNVAYAYFATRRYQRSYYYYNQALKKDNSSLIDISGRGWSAYYLGKASLAYRDFQTVHNSEYENSIYDGMGIIKKFWKSHYGEVFTVLDKNKNNLNLSYSYHLYNFSMGFNYNLSKAKDSNREMITLGASYKLGKLSFDFSSMNAKGDYKKLYDGYGLALKSSYLMMFKSFQSNLSMLGGYTYFESLSSQQARLDFGLNTESFGISSGLSYLYLDYITPDYDQEEILYHASLYYKIIPAITFDYKINLGKNHFAYNEYLIPYDDYEVDNLWHSIGLTWTIRSLSLYLKYINQDLEEDSFGIGVGYVF